MITIYPPQESAVKLRTLHSKATMSVANRRGLSTSDYKELVKDMQRAIDLIESIPCDYEGYIKNQEKINQSICNFNENMYLKWG